MAYNTRGFNSFFNPDGKISSHYLPESLGSAPAPAPPVSHPTEDYGQPTTPKFGRAWVTRDSSWKAGGPQANDQWGASLAEFSNAGLKLSTSASPYKGSEVSTTDVMGYGTYSVSFEGDFDAFDSSTVFGAFMFDWSEDAVPGYKEIDLIEISRWGGSELTGKFTIYPDNSPVSAPVFSWPTGLKKATIVMEWLPQSISWKLYDGQTEVYSAAITTRVFSPDRQQLHINMWHFESAGWDSVPAQQVQVTDIEFTPAELSVILEGKSNFDHTHPIEDVQGLQSALTAIGSGTGVPMAIGATNVVFNDPPITVDGKTVYKTYSSISFPAGRFAAAPYVLLTPLSKNPEALMGGPTMESGTSTTGGSIWLASTTGVATRVQWFAVEVPA